ncbi:MAG: PilZ domain-containing protein [Desulfomonilia bacterium]
MEEQRREKREYIEIDARYHDESGVIRCGRVGNISPGGIYIKTDIPLPQGFFLSLSLDAHDLGKVIDVQGYVVRSDPGRGMAIKFSNTNRFLLEELIRMLVKITSASGNQAEGLPNEDTSLSRKQEHMTKETYEYRKSGAGVKEKRRKSRKPLRIEARYQDANGTVLKGTVRNISTSGVFIETSKPLAVGEFIHLSLDAVDIGKVIDVHGRVARSIPDTGMGIAFADQNNRDIQLLLRTMRKIDQACLMALSRSALEE